MIEHHSVERPRGPVQLTSLGALMVAGVLAGIALVAARPSPVLAGAGGCTLLVRSGSESPPVAHLDLYAGQSAMFEGSFIPEAEVVFRMFIDGVPYGTPTTHLADADGSIDSIGLSIQFWGTDVGHWTIEASVPETECVGTASVTVTGVVVSVATFICDEDIQSAEDLAAASPTEVCDSLVLPGDEVSVPPGHTDNQATANFDWELHESTAQERNLDDATRGGDGTCDPAAMHCIFALTYEWVGAVGHSTLYGTPPVGYRFGTAQWIGPDASAFTLAGVTGTVLSFTVIGGAEEPHSVHVYYFADGAAPAGPPSHVGPSSPPTPAVGVLPNTALRSSPGGTHGWALLLVGAFVASGAVIAARVWWRSGE